MTPTRPEGSVVVQPPPEARGGTAPIAAVVCAEEQPTRPAPSVPPIVLGPQRVGCRSSRSLAEDGENACNGPATRLRPVTAMTTGTSLTTRRRAATVPNAAVTRASSGASTGPTTAAVTVPVLEVRTAPVGMARPSALASQGASPPVGLPAALPVVAPATPVPEDSTPGRSPSSCCGWTRSGSSRRAHGASGCRRTTAPRQSRPTCHGPILRARCRRRLRHLSSPSRCSPG